MSQSRKLPNPGYDPRSECAALCRDFDPFVFYLIPLILHLASLASIQRFAKQPRILGVVEKIAAAGNEMAANVDNCHLPAK